MRVISREKIEKREFIRGVIPVFFLQEDAAAVKAAVLDPLSGKGYQVEPVAHDPATCQSLLFAQNVRAAVQHSRCGILVFSQALLEQRNVDCSLMFGYELGLMEGQKSELYPFLLDGRSEDFVPLFQGKPVANIQSVTRIEKIIDALVATRVPREQYLADVDLNNLVTRRIQQVRLTVIFDIWQSTLLELWNDAETPWDSGGATFDEKAVDTMIERLFEDVHIGALVLRFGKKETLAQEPFSLYERESTPILFDSPAQFEKTSSPKHLEYDLSAPFSQAEDRILTTVKLEFPVPVHEVLGSSYVPYLAVKLQSPWKPPQLMRLLAQSGKGLAEGAAPARDALRTQRLGREHRLYFTLPGPTTEVDAEMQETYGATCNFIFPQ